jgi:signal recognition particle receptor subunit beta
MVQFNFFRREVNCKIVYYGPGLSGKTTNLEVVHQKTPGNNRGDLTCISTEQDRTLFFDFMPIELGKVAGMNTKLRLFTVPGQPFYNSTRKLVLQGADGVIFVADSQEKKIQENLESLKNLEENLAEYGINIRDIPLVIQWNKRDMPNILEIADLEREINYLGVPTVPAVAPTGEGVFPTLKACATMVLASVSKKVEKAGQQTLTSTSPLSKRTNPTPIAATKSEEKKPMAGFNNNKKKPIFKRFEKKFKSPNFDKKPE